MYDYAHVHTAKGMTIFRPQTVDELCRVLRRHPGRVCIRGAGFSHSWRATPQQTGTRGFRKLIAIATLFN